MKEQKVQINKIVRNQLPEYIREDFPLISEFLSQYYLSQEVTGASYDLIQNIDQYIKLDKITNLDSLETPVLLDNISSIDTDIEIKRDLTKGYQGEIDKFPTSYGLLQVNNEIITYRKKVVTNEFIGFVDCIRGFSGITDLKNLTFNESVASTHASGSKIINLSSLFLKEFLSKVKYQLSPGFENRNFYSGINENVLLKQIKDFYSSKGTDESFKILFKILYGEDVKIIRPKENIFKPSGSNFNISKNFVAEAVEGDLSELVDTTIWQDDDFYYTKSYAPVAEIEKLYNSTSTTNNNLYKFKIDAGYNRDLPYDGAAYGKLKVHPKTKVIGNIQSFSTIIDVDSTIGFPKTDGKLSVKYSDGTTGIVEYKETNINQFLGCIGITNTILDASDISISSYAYSKFNENIKFRLTPVLNSIDNPTESFYFRENDSIKIKTLGNENSNIILDSLIYNIPLTYDIVSFSLISASQDTFIYKVKIQSSDGFTSDENINVIGSFGEEFEFVILDVTNTTEISIKGLNELIPSRFYKIKKQLNKVNFSNFLDINLSNANIQNTYIDIKFPQETIISSSSLPFFGGKEINLKSKEIIFPERRIDNQIETFLGDTFKITELSDHGLYTGDAVYYTPEKTTDTEGNEVVLSELFKEGLYFVKRVDKNRIKLAKSRSDIYYTDNDPTRKSRYVTVQNETVIQNNKLEKYLFNNKDLKSQKILRKIYNQPVNASLGEDSQKYKNLGMFVNGVELLNYRSRDSISYGKIEKINVIGSGENYDVINPPNLQILDYDGEGTGAKGYCSVLGSLLEVRIVDPGFGYLEDPIITVTGGNGSGAKVSPNMKLIDHSSIFDSKNGISTSTSTIGFSTYHKFRTGEKIFYRSYSQTSVGGLSTNSSYYVSSISEKEVKLHKTFSDSISGINTISLVSVGSGNHSLDSEEKKLIISSVTVLDPGSGYENKRRTVKTSGINTSLDFIEISDHGFNSGEVIQYTAGISTIGGLVNNQEYYVLKLDNDRFRLCGISTISEEKDFLYKTNQYQNLTSVGSGVHTFNYPPISLKISEKFVDFEKQYKCVLDPIFRGEITSVHLEEHGTNYGTKNVINFVRNPIVKVSNGEGALLTPIINGGKISHVSINNAGKNYVGSPDLILDGDGVGAILTPIVKNGEIKEIKIIEGGIGYTNNTTRISVIPSGEQAVFETFIQKWTVNEFVRRFSDISEDDGFLDVGVSGDLQYYNMYASRFLRQNLFVKDNSNNKIYGKFDLEIQNNKEASRTIGHSPIVGWAYDGSPIYGPYGYKQKTGGDIVQLKSGYELKGGLDISPNRPPIDQFEAGFFIEDYEYINSFDEDVLDENNGRYCVTPEFPNGIYAYFSTFEDKVSTDGPFLSYKSPKFPYVIGKKYNCSPINFNFNSLSTQNNIDLENGGYVRNTYYYRFLQDGFNYDYVNLPDKLNQDLRVKSVFSGSVDEVSVLDGGNNYKVDDEVIFSSVNGEETFASAKVSVIEGKKISSVSGFSTFINDIEIYPSSNSKSYVVYSKNPHNLNNLDTIIINDYDKKNDLSGVYKVNVSTNTFILSGTGSTNISVENSSTTGLVTYFSIYGNLTDKDIRSNDVYQVGNEKVKVLDVDFGRSRIRVLRNYDNTVGSSHSVYSKLVELPRKFDISSSIEKDSLFKLNKEIYFDPEQSVGFGTSHGVGITSTIFLSSTIDLSRVGFSTGSVTFVTFKNPKDFEKYKNRRYVDIVNSTNSVFNKEKVRVISADVTSNTIRIDFDTSAFSGLGVTAYLNIRNYLEVPTKTIYVPKHNLNTNDELIYHTNDQNSQGIVVSFENNVGIATTRLLDNQVLYVAKFTDDLIGISTVKVAISTSNNTFVGIASTQTQAKTLFFIHPGIGSYHSFKTRYSKNSGEVIKNIISVNTEQANELTVGDEVFIDLKVKENFNYNVVYNDYSRSLLINPVGFSTTNINKNSNSIYIQNHKFNSGQKVLYSSSTYSENNKFYYVIKLDSNTISLSDTEYNSLKSQPNIINIGQFSDGYLSLVNPPITAYRDCTITFNLSDSSLSYLDGSEYFSAFDFKIFNDPDFTKEYESFNIKKYGVIGITQNASVVLQIDDSIKTDLYYNLVPRPRKNIPLEKLEYLSDVLVSLNNKIEVKNSVYYGNQIVTGLSTSIFTYITNVAPEKNNYENDDLSSSIKYTTTSKSALGKIKNVLITNGGSYYTLPGISTIITDSGNLAILETKSKTIGKVKKTKINDIGYDFPADPTLRPKVIYPQILKINLLSILDNVKVLENGIGYITNPKLIVLDGLTNEVENGVDLVYDSLNKNVKILSNFANLNSVTPKILPINNSNGVGISSVGFNTVTKDVTVTLSVGFSTLSSFPFSVNDKVLIENVSVGINSIGKGYNSSDYGYKLFTLTSVSPKIGGIGSVSYNISDLLEDNEIPGTFVPILSSGRIIPEKHFPKFDISIKVLDYKVGEKVEQDGIVGKVLGWDNRTKYLKVTSKDKILANKRIKGITSKANGIVNEIEYFDSFSNYGTSSTVENGWGNSVGFLNDNNQRIQDNFYYQNFSYSIKSKVDYETWKDAVNSLNHTLGYRNFSDFDLESKFTFGNTIPISSVINVTSLSQNQSIGEEIVYIEDVFNIKVGDFIRFESSGSNDKVEIVGLGNTYVTISETLSSNYSKGAIVNIDRITSGIGTGILVVNEEIPLDNFSTDINTASEFLRGTVDVLSDSGLVCEIIGKGDFNTIYDYDRCLENSITIENQSFSDTIFLKSRFLTDYFLAKGNRILVIDDISSKFDINPRKEKYSIVSSFSTDEVQSQKYIIYAKDKRYYFDRQITLVDLVNNGKNVYINQYANVFTRNDIGSYDARIVDDQCQLLFYPNKFKVNDYEVTILSYNLNDSLSSIGNTSLGSCVDVFTNTTNTSLGSTTIVSVGTSYRSIKAIVQISNLDNSYQFDEISIIHDGNKAYISEYGQLVSGSNEYSSSGFGTFYPYISDSKVKIDFIPYNNESLTVNTIQIGIKTESVSGISTTDLKNVRLESRSTTITSSPTPTENVIGEYPNQFDAAYFIVQISDTTNNRYKTSNVVVLDDYDEILGLNESYFVEFGDVDTSGGLGIGTVGTKINGSKTQLTFTPNPNINVDVKVYMNSFNYLDQDNIQKEFANIIKSGYEEYQGTFFDIKKSFDLSFKGTPIFERVFDASDPNIVNLSQNSIYLNNHFFVSGEKIEYSFAGDSSSANAIGIATTSISGIGSTDRLPKTVYTIVSDSSRIKLASSAHNALSGISLDLKNLGIGTYHRFTSTNKDSKTLICIDNVIQSPLVPSSKQTLLSKQIFITSDVIYLSDPNYIFTGDLLKVDDEIMLVEGVGIGSTNSVRVRRPYVGTSISAHSNGSTVTKFTGNYTIKNNKIHFVSPPDGKFLISTSTNSPDEQDWDGLYRNSRFQGRVFTRTGVVGSNKDTYADNYLFDDLSTEFNSQQNIFELKSNGSNISGISTYNSILLINDILQFPGNSFDFVLKENAGITTVKFMGGGIQNIKDVNTSYLPSTGVIISVGSSNGFGYQPLISAGGTSVVSSAGTISQIIVNNQGSGYRSTNKLEVLTKTSASIGIGSTQIFIENENSIYKILDLIKQGLTIGVGTYIKPIPIVSIASTSVFVDALEGVSQYVIPKGTTVKISLIDPKIGIVNIGITTDNTSSSYFEKSVSHLGITTVINGQISTSTFITNVGSGFTEFYTKQITKLTNSIGIGSTELFVESTNNAFINDFITIGNYLKNVRIVGVSSTSVYIGSSSTISSSIPSNQTVDVKYYNPPKILFEDPLSYTNIPLIYSSPSSGIGTQATINLIVGQDSSVIDFEFQNLGYYYREGDVLTIPVGGTTGIPTSMSFNPFQITITKTFSDKFAGWTIGNLIVLDDISKYFDGDRQSFNLTYEGSPISIIKSKSSLVELENILLISVNNIIQEPGKSYTFSGGSILSFTEPPKIGDDVKIILYKGTGDQDVVLIPVVETAKVGDRFIVKNHTDNDYKNILFEQEPRPITRLYSSNISNTNPYYGVGKNINVDFERSLNLTRQTEDILIDGIEISKNRKFYEPLINPISNIISNVYENSTQIYVDNIRPFFNQENESITVLDFQNSIDIISLENKRSGIATALVSGDGFISEIDLIDGGDGYLNSPDVFIQDPTNSGTKASLKANISFGKITSISVLDTGSGYDFNNPPLILIESPTMTLENNKKVSQYNGDDGIVVGVAVTNIPGEDYYSILSLDLFVPTYSNLRKINLVGTAVTLSSLTNGDYFIIKNSNVSIGSSFFASISDEEKVIGICTEFVDSIYQVKSSEIIRKNVIGIGLTYINRVRTMVAGIGTVNFSSTEIKFDLTSYTFDNNNLKSLSETSFIESNYFGGYSWGKITLDLGVDNSYYSYILNGSKGISNSDFVRRTSPLKYLNYKT